MNVRGARPGVARRRPQQREKSEQQHALYALRLVNAKVYTIGTRRRRGSRCPQCNTFVPEDQGTRQTPGLPDLLAFVPRPDAPEQRWVLFVEQKAAGGRLSPEQQELRALALAAGAEHVVGDYNAVLAWLVSKGLMRETQLPHYRLRPLTDALQRLVCPPLE